MINPKNYIKFLLLFYLSPLFLIAIEPDFHPEDYLTREITAIRISHPLKIDGLLNEEFYQSTPYQTFIQIEPNNGEPATEATDFWICYDDEALYLGARLWDSQPDSIVCRMGRRDSDFESDNFLLAIDSYHDNRSGFYFIINPSGAIQDGTISNDSWFDETWDGIWEGKARIDENGWTVEMRIPFSQLRFNKQEEHVWGIGLGRKIQRKSEQDFFTYFKRGDSGVVSHFAQLRGIKDIQPPGRVEFFPYFTSSYSLLPSLKDNPFFKGKDSNIKLGTDFKVGIGNNLTIDATINPDFGQVEVDPSVINLSAYETYYQEKRPFFIEGSNIFSFGKGGPTNRWGFNFFEPDFFYSRRIGRPPQTWVNTDGWVNMPEATSILGAAKLSGKLKGDWSLGGLTAITNREYAQIKEGKKVREEEVEPLTTFNLIRVQKELNEGDQGLGWIGTYVNRFFKDSALRDVFSDNALALGIDGWTFWGKERDWVIAGWSGVTNITGSRTRILDLQQNSSHFFQRPDAEHVHLDTNLTKLQGYAGRIILNKEKGHIILNSALGFISPGFENNDMGLNFGADRINTHVVFGYKWYDPGDVFRYAQIRVAYMNNHNFGWTKVSENFFLFGYGQFLNYWSMNGFMGWGPRTLSDTKLRGGPLVISPSGSFISVGINTDNRKNIVFGFGGNMSQREKGSRSFGVNSDLELRLGNRLNLTVAPEFSTDKSIDQYVTQVPDENASYMYGNRYILAQIDQKTFSTDIRIEFTFTPTLSFQAYFQPFMSVGKYSKFKEFTSPKSYDFLVYGEEGSSIKKVDSQYFIDPTGGTDEDEFMVSDPDFNYKALVGNAVLRWEFSPGSTLYLVWTRNGYNYEHPGDFQFRRDLKEIFKATTDNAFAIKITYWIG